MPGSCFPVKIVYSLGDHMEDFADAAIDVVLDIHQNQPAGAANHIQLKLLYLYSP